MGLKTKPRWARRMRRAALRLAILLAAPGLAAGCQREPERPWPPGVQEVPEHSPVLSPEAAADTFFLPPGYRLDLVASEPLVADPVWLDIDPDGRVWVVEMRGFMPDNEAASERAPVGRVVVLDDDDDDGRADRSTVFLDGLVLPRSVKVLEHGVLVGAPPHLWLARDTNGDGRADTKELVRDDYGRADGNPEHNANGLLWAMDNWIYTSEHDGHFRLRNGRLVHHETPSVGQWGLSMDDVGRVFRNWNDDPLRVDVFPARYFLRNPNVVRMRGVYEQLTRDVTVWPVRPNPGVNRGYREGTLHQDRSLAVFAAAGTPTVYRGDRLPEELRGNVFVTEPAGNVVRRFVVSRDENGRLQARNPYERAEFIASTDERFRPVNLFSAPDGTLYVVDMYRGVIQHRQYQSEYLRHYIEGRKLDQPIGLGRIYRVVHDSTRRDRKPALGGRTAAELVGLLSHPNGWWRDTAQRLLVERGDRSVAHALRNEASAAPDPRTRLHALWTLDGIDAIDPESVRRALTDAEPHVRAAAVRLSERWLREPDHAIHGAVLERRQDPHALVRQQLAMSAGELAGPGREAVLGELLMQHGDDPLLVDAAISGLHGRELRVLDRLLGGPGTPGTDVVTMLAAAVIRSHRHEEAWQVLQWVTEADRPEAQRLAIVEGIEAAFQTTAPPSLGPPVGGTRLTLRRRPAALIAAAASDDALGRRVANVLPLVDWPGRPKPREDAPPLDASQQQRFTAGRQTYDTTCAPCHQADGRGRDGVAPSLVGSKWVLGRPGLMARVVLGGKEGTMMMPPVALSDEQSAAVLTYVRRAWGNTATPVGVALVREVRGASTGRQRPWTEAELLKVTQPDGWPPISE